MATISPIDALRDTINEAGWSQADAAMLIGITQSTLNRWLTGRVNPPNKKLAAALIRVGLNPSDYGLRTITIDEPTNDIVNNDYESELLNRCDTLEHKIDELSTIIKRMNDTIDHIEHNYLDKHKDCQ